MEYFLAIQEKQEMSLRALYLTLDLVHLNPALYSVWYVHLQNHRSLARFQVAIAAAKFL
jgi:hypothetical protein